MCDDSEYFHVEHMVDEGAEEVIDGQGNEETSAGKNRLLHLVHEYVRLFNMHVLFLGSGSFLPKWYMSSGARRWGWGGVGLHGTNPSSFRASLLYYFLTGKSKESKLNQSTLTLHCFGCHSARIRVS